jgi:hypothetical protein
MPDTRREIQIKKYVRLPRYALVFQFYTILREAMQAVIYSCDSPLPMWHKTALHLTSLLPLLYNCACSAFADAATGNEMRGASAPRNFTVRFFMEKAFLLRACVG